MEANKKKSLFDALKKGLNLKPLKNQTKNVNKYITNNKNPHINEKINDSIAQ